MNYKDIKSLKSVNRDLQIESGVKLTTKTMLSRKDKQNDPRRQRKTRAWQKETSYSFC